MQWSGRILQILLDLLWELQEVHQLGHPGPRKAFSGGDSSFGDPRVALHFLAPEASSVVRVYADWIDIALVARF